MLDKLFSRHDSIIVFSQSVSMCGPMAHHLRQEAFSTAGMSSKLFEKASKTTIDCCVCGTFWSFKCTWAKRKKNLF